ncbi:Peptidyl-prolyl cis-trans isomerase [hydrothermal vent metagenome]|uniref:peptidylprolyl isomerase n=1 Tax=hydrothermal vent metagenome TaxID=652676 RepID=A0A3B0RR25_9ZZZZ
MSIRRLMLSARNAIMLTAMVGATAANAMDDPVEPLTPARIIETAPESVWRKVDPENTVYMDLPAGLVIIELRPDVAPGHVKQIKTLVRNGFYNGLSFHRVIEGFMAQGGDPLGTGAGGSDLPDLKAEFSRDTSDTDEFVEIGRDRIAPRVGFIDGMPFGAQPEALRAFKTDRHVDLWPLHCPGVMSMARTGDPNSANSQFFLMIGDARLNLDRRYSAWGWIVDGFEASRRIARGEPPTRPTPIMRVRIAADVPDADRREVEVMRTDSETFMRYIKARGDVDETGSVKNICEIKIPARINGEIER